MKRNFYLVAALAAGMAFAACKKKVECKVLAPTNNATAAETAFLQNYMNANGLQNVVSIRNGMFYQIVRPGEGFSPNLCANIDVNYKGRLINGTSVGGMFDSTAAGSRASFGLDGLITGWKVALTQLRPGGKMDLYIPPSLGYGANAQPARTGFVGIPANSFLKFEIELLAVRNDD
jgi:FKBP-type peptidyl-prolyl cis-trans isomerase FkpA